MKYRLYTYEVYGSTRDGYEINDIFGTSDYFDIDDDMTDKKIIQSIGFKRSWDMEIDSQIFNDDIIYFRNKRNGKPACELRRVQDES